MVHDATRTGTQSVMRAINLLKLFSDAQPEWSLSDLARAAALNKTTAHRLLTALEQSGLLARHHRTGAYRLGPESIALGGRALRANDLRSASLDELEALAAHVGEAATIEILVGDEVLILEEIAARHLIAPWQTIGTRHPAHATSTGKLLLAFAAPANRAAAIRLPLPRLTAQTITDPAMLLNQLAEIRSCGYATAFGELEPDYVAISAPVRNHDGHVVAAVSIGGPATRLSGNCLPEVVGHVQQAGQRISARLGYDRPSTDTDTHTR